MTLTRSDLASAFASPIAPVPVTTGYRLRLLLAVAGLVLLQALYLALIATVIALTAAWVLWSLTWGVRLNWISVLFYLAPPAAGLILTFFLFKPILARPPKPLETLELTPESEPVLFGFVERLCSTLGSPAPRRIRVDLQVNASAALDGWRGFVTGDLTLVIGLPLAHSLTLPQFAGVLAHEFGHFAQRTGMRSYYLIQLIQRWFARVVFERDGWDQWLEGHDSDGEDWRMRIMRWIARGGVTLGRRYLALLLKAAQWISAGLSRQMEFDADRYEASIVGPAVFRQTSLRLIELMHAADRGWDTTQRQFEIGRLPDSMPRVTLVHERTMGDQDRERLHASELDRSAGRLDSHPSTADRIKSVERANPTPVFTLSGSASRLFRDLDAISREATGLHYRQVLGDRYAPGMLVASDEIVATLEDEIHGENTLNQFLGNETIYWFALPSVIPEVAPDGPLEPLAIDHEKLAFLLHAWFHAEVTTMLADAGARPPDHNPAALGPARQAFDDFIRPLRAAAAPFINAMAVAAHNSAEGATLWRSIVALESTRPHFCRIQQLLSAAASTATFSLENDAAHVANSIDRFHRLALDEVQVAMAIVAGIPASITLDPRRLATLDAQLDPGSTENAADEFTSRWARIQRNSYARLLLLTGAASVSGGS